LGGSPDARAPRRAVASLAIDERQGVTETALKPRARRPVARVISARRLVDSGRLGEQIDRLYRAAWALCGSSHDAEDLVQETFARVLARPRRLRGDDELPYLLGALRNTYLNGVRTLGRRPRTVALADDDGQVLRSGRAVPEVALEQREVLAAIAALPEGFRDVLVAVDLVGLSYREAAGLLGAPVGTITSRLFRARRRIAGSLAVSGQAAAARDGSGG
jgi:RNA polymerase sigma-70 factor (ECF subfamily)